MAGNARSCSVSVFQSTVTKAMIKDIFAQTHVTLTIPHRHGCRWHELGFLALSDVAWATRNDGNRQGSLPEEAFPDLATINAVLGSKSFNLNRVSSSSLNADTHAAATAADPVDSAKKFWGLIQDPSADPLGAAVRHATPFGLVIVAKSLYDSVKKESTMRSATCKRSGVANTHWNRSPIGIVRTTGSRWRNKGLRTTITCAMVATAEVPSGVQRFVHRSQAKGHRGSTRQRRRGHQASRRRNRVTLNAVDGKKNPCQLLTPMLSRGRPH